MVLLLYLLFFLSGAAALVYQVVWVRSLSLVFGGSHLAVTTVLAVFMGGLALGGWVFGRRADRAPRPLRLYGWLEIGIGLAALLFALLMRLYPSIYVPLARVAETNPYWLTALRVAFAILAMIVPTTLMGGTLPVLARFVAARPARLGGHLAFLYGFNTLGAVAGTLTAAFALLPGVGVTRSLFLAVGVNLAVGLIALALPERVFESGGRGAPGSSVDDRPEPAGPTAPLASRVVLWGIGISGFCALGYEVLWTRVLTMVVGTSVYSFAIMLVAFLTGIAVGSQAERLLARFVSDWDRAVGKAVVAFGCVQIVIGLTALATTYLLRDLPTHAMRLQDALAAGGDEFGAQQLATFVLAFSFMAVPAFFMGLAFPLAGAVHARTRGQVGGAVGEALAFNTVGAILGAAATGFVLLFLLGVERSLQVLIVVNVGLGLLVLAAALAGPRRRAIVAAIAAGTAAAVLALAALPQWGRMWDRKYFAIFRNNQRYAFETREQIEDALRNTDVLYYHEGINETISVIRPKKAERAFIVNGRVEASTHIEDVQCQRTLGHLPMLAHPDPKRVFVLGTGTGMTLGATTLHPEADSITLAEIEPGVLGATRQFGDYNREALDSPKLRVVFNDGRNFLRTTRETFDVITADPIHPWSGGASYLYTDEYWQVVASRLAPGGVVCQWLPIYELSVEDLRSVVATFAGRFRHVALWLTHYDAELLASQDPIVFDERRIDARISATPKIAEDLGFIDMGTARDFLSYMIAGNEGVRAFAAGGVINTDDNLWLEFSSPRSKGEVEHMGNNVLALGKHRESPFRHTVSLADPAAEAERREFWERAARASGPYDEAHALGLWNRWDEPAFVERLTMLRRDFPEYAPARFLERELRVVERGNPIPVASEVFPVIALDGSPSRIEITAVTLLVGEGRGAAVFVDNARREVYAETYLEAPEPELRQRLEAHGRRVLAAMREEYAALTAAAGTPGFEQASARLRAAAVRATAD